MLLLQIEGFRDMRLVVCTARGRRTSAEGVGVGVGGLIITLTALLHIIRIQTHLNAS